MRDITIKEMNQTEREQCIDLLRRTYKGKSDEHTFEWRFETQQRKKPILVVAKDSNKIISFLSWMPWGFSYNGNDFIGYQAGEAATEIEYRKKGIWGNVINYGHKIAIQRDVDFVFGFPSTLSYNALYRAGYFPIAACFFHVRLLNPFRCDHNEIMIRQEHTELPFLKQPDRITPVVGKEYFSWRYVKNTKEYKILEYNDQNHNITFFCREKRWKKIPEVLLMDVQVTTYNEMFINKAFACLDDYYSRKAAYIRTFFSENTERGEMLRRYFPHRIKSKYDIFIIKPLSDRIRNNILLNFNCWDIMPHCVDEY